MKIIAILEDPGGGKLQRRGRRRREGGWLRKALVSRLTGFQLRIGQRHAQDARPGRVNRAGEAGLAGMHRLHEPTAVVDAPEPEVAQDFAVPRRGPHHHARELSVELAGGDDRRGVILGRADQEPAVFGIGGRSDFEVEPSGEQGGRSGEEEGGSGNPAEVEPAGFHGGQFLLRAHPSKRQKHAGQESERERVGEDAGNQERNELHALPAAHAPRGHGPRDLVEDVARDQHEDERPRGDAARDGGFGQDVAVEEAHTSIQAEPSPYSKAKGSGRR